MGMDVLYVWIEKDFIVGL